MEEEMTKEEFLYGAQARGARPDNGSIREPWQEQVAADGLEAWEAGFLEGYDEEAHQRIVEA